MTKSEWIFNEGNHCLYQEPSGSEDDKHHIGNTNPVSLIIDQPQSFQIKTSHADDSSFCRISIDIPADIMDNAAVAWCKARNLKVNKYTLDELLEQSDDELDDIGHSKLVLERDDQEELPYDNIFEVVASNSRIAKEMKVRSDEFLKLREAGQVLSKQAAYLTKISSNEEHDAALALLEILIEDYDSNLLLIDALSASIARFEKIEP